VTISNATVADIGAITLNGFGIAFVDGAHYGTVQYCYVHNIGLDGIHFRSSDYGKIQYNDVRLTGDDGVAFCLCEYGLMLNNTIDRSLDRNWASNARLAGSKYCTIQSNTLIGSPNHGICCDGFKEVIPKSNQFIQNTFQNCTKSDIYAEGTYTKTTNLISKP
jgi:hypothetical protein